MHDQVLRRLLPKLNNERVQMVQKVDYKVNLSLLVTLSVGCIGRLQISVMIPNPLHQVDFMMLLWRHCQLVGGRETMLLSG